MSLSPYRLHQTRAAMDDGRILNLYDFAPTSQNPPFLDEHLKYSQENPPGSPRVLENPPEMRWNPVLGEWVVYAANRMNRPQLPSREACPLCPGILELPLPYQVAIFENRAPAMAYVPGDTTVPSTQNVFELTVPARGRCDMVVYSQQHDAKFAQMPLNDIYGLIESWRSRYAELVAQPEIRYVSIFENKGREAGMTLDHPHGQIYSFSFLPPFVAKQWEQTDSFSGQKQGLWERVIEKELRDKVRVIAQTDHFLAAQPFYARYPYEVHIFSTRDGVSSLLEMTPAERRELAGLMKNITLRYENLWPNAAYGFPTLMVMQQLTNVPGAERFRFHVEFYPLQRSPEKLKYRASIETGTGTFLNDALPENQAAELRATAPLEVELPGVLFEEVTG